MSQTPSKTNTPLVVDLDGTLTLTDTLVESLIHLIKQSPLNLLRAPLWLLKGRAGFKAIIAEKTCLAAGSLPYREPLVAYLRAEKAQGRRIILATAAHATIADAVARQLGLFDQVLATTPGHNLKGRAKLKAIQENAGSSFVYAGDTQADLPIWQAAKAAILVGVPPALAATVREKTPIEREFPNEKATLTDWLRALRVHQWIKNLLLFVPLLTAFSFMEINKLFSMGLAFLAFSLAASATYIVNDLWDLDSDRLHPRKRLRPFASARLSVLHGLAVAGASLASAFLLAYCVSISFCLMLLAYLALTSAYSWTLKKYVLIDAIMLSLLYTLRILAGAVAIGVATSSWLLAFSVFIFLSLALVKRCAELVSLEKSGLDKAHGRDYRVTDLTVLWPLGVGTALSAVVVFGLFISSPETQTRYATPQLLWLVAIGLVYWLGRLWIKTSRGEMHDDPVVYAIKDDGSRITVAIMLFVMLMAHFFALGS
ncbi:MAG: UbiA family prenyltransferase [Rugosibacter sp.]|jgi:4-hydroxybenzoate polyprenyltransferase